MSRFEVKVSTEVELLRWVDPREVMFEPFILEEEMVRCIVENDEGKLVTDTQLSVESLMSNRGNAVNITGMERYCPATQGLVNDVKRSLGHYGPATMHIFVTPTGARSFPEHTDPDVVILCLLEGKKIFEIEGEQFEMEIGKFYRIPADAPHRAVYNEDSIMLSIGLEFFLKDKLGWKQK